jgi:hypothetical protein
MMVYVDGINSSNWTTSRQSIEMMSQVATTWLNVALGSLDSAFISFSVRPFIATTLERSDTYVLNETSFGLFGMYRILDVGIELARVSDTSSSISNDDQDEVLSSYQGRLTVEFDYSRMIRKSSWFSIDPDKWIDVAVVLDGAQEHIRFYVNGVMRGIDVFFRQSAIHVDSIIAIVDSLQLTLALLEEDSNSISTQLDVAMPFAVHVGGFDGNRADSATIIANDHMSASAILFGEYANLVIGDENPPLFTPHEEQEQDDRSELPFILENVHQDGISNINCRNGYTEIWSNLQSMHALLFINAVALSAVNVC